MLRTHHHCTKVSAKPSSNSLACEASYLGLGAWQFPRAVMQEHGDAAVFHAFES